MKTVIVIGGGASGMMAAVAAARHGAAVTILEHTDRVGRKLLSTGNGKCNYTNQKQGLRFYRGEDPAFVLPVLKQFDAERTMAFFRELGIVAKERNGFIYPASGQASSVLDVLRMELRRMGVTVVTGCAPLAVKRNADGFWISAADGKAYASDSCIFACGGLAFPKSGSDGSAFSLLKSLGHSFTPVAPALVQMTAKQSFFKSIAGVRADAAVHLWIDGKWICSDRGEVQMTKDGISGIPSFQVSRYASYALQEGRRVQAELDFVPDWSKEALQEELLARFHRDDGKTAGEALVGFFPGKLIPVVLKECRIALHDPAQDVCKEAIETLAGLLKRMRIDITGTAGFDKAQTTAGGLRTDEFLPQTLESGRVRGLYAAGEVLDVDGMCGGYNLQWAWSSGYVAGMHAAKEDV